MSIFTTKLRTLVSQDRVRHEELSLNIDLTYITERILAMSFPATGIEAAWRNDIQDVCQLLRTKHKNNFLVFNLSERDYEYDLLDNQIVCFPFKDHHAPPLHIIFQIIFNMDSWLKANDQHVAIVHCIGGKGRTGLIIVCYLFYCGMFPDVDKCLEYFAGRRSAKGKGVTQPSQLRYVRYFCGLVSSKLQISLNPLLLTSVSVGPVPKGFYVYIEFYPQLYAETSTADDDETQDHLIFSTFAPPESRLLEDARYRTECSVELSGDILVRGYIVGLKDTKNKNRLFRMQFHTGLVHRGEVAVPKSQLDDLDKDKKKYASDFDLRLNFDSTDCHRNSIMAYNLIFNQMREAYQSDQLKKEVPQVENGLNNSTGVSSSAGAHNGGTSGNAGNGDNGGYGGYGGYGGSVGGNSDSGVGGNDSNISGTGSIGKSSGFNTSREWQRKNSSNGKEWQRMTAHPLTLTPLRRSNSAGDHGTENSPASSREWQQSNNNNTGSKFLDGGRAQRYSVVGAHKTTPRDDNQRIEELLDSLESKLNGITNKRQSSIFRPGYEEGRQRPSHTASDPLESQVLSSHDSLDSPPLDPSQRLSLPIRTSPLDVSEPPSRHASLLRIPSTPRRWASQYEPFVVPYPPSPISTHHTPILGSSPALGTPSLPSSPPLLGSPLPPPLYSPRFYDSPTSSLCSLNTSQDSLSSYDPLNYSPRDSPSPQHTPQTTHNPREPPTLSRESSQNTLDILQDTLQMLQNTLEILQNSESPPNTPPSPPPLIPAPTPTTQIPPVPELQPRSAPHDPQNTPQDQQPAQHTRVCSTMNDAIAGVVVEAGLCRK